MIYFYFIAVKSHNTSRSNDSLQNAYNTYRTSRTLHKYKAKSDIMLGGIILLLSCFLLYK